MELRNTIFKYWNIIAEFVKKHSEIFTVLGLGIIFYFIFFSWNWYLFIDGC